MNQKVLKNGADYFPLKWTGKSIICSWALRDRKLAKREQFEAAPKGRRLRNISGKMRSLVFSTGEVRNSD